MPFTSAQITTGANYSLATFQKKDPIDQVNVKHRTLDWLVKNKIASTFGNGSFKEPVYYDNNQNYQNYFGADQVTYNERDPAMWTDFKWFNNHDGFWFDEDRLLAAGITLTDDRNAVPTAAEKEALIDLLKVSYTALRNGIQSQLALELLGDGSASTKACPGLANVVKTAPTTGTVGGIDAATFSWWRNNTNTSIAKASLIDEMEETWRDCMKFGGLMPNFIVCGASFLDIFRGAANDTVNRQLNGGGNAKGGVTLDPATNALFFHGVQLVWDPTFEEKDTADSTTTQTKTCYFLNSQAIALRPVKGNWMVNRKPERLPDRYVHYFGQTSKYSLTTNQRNALAVLTASGS
jgi:hypothetical protein